MPVDHLPPIALAPEDHRHPKLDDLRLLPRNQRSLVALELDDIAKVRGAVPDDLGEAAGHLVNWSLPPSLKFATACRLADSMAARPRQGGPNGFARVASSPSDHKVRVALDVGTQRVPVRLDNHVQFLLGLGHAITPSAGPPMVGPGRCITPVLIGPIIGMSAP